MILCKKSKILGVKWLNLSSSYFCFSTFFYLYINWNSHIYECNFPCPKARLLNISDTQYSQCLQNFPWYEKKTQQMQALAYLFTYSRKTAKKTRHKTDNEMTGVMLWCWKQSRETNGSTEKAWVLWLAGSWGLSHSISAHLDKSGLWLCFPKKRVLPLLLRRKKACMFCSVQ